jgi:ATP-dependent Clp endopeptidase proteolytic subunit ClpP
VVASNDSDDGSSDASDDLNIQCVKNRIYFYEDVNTKSIIRLCKEVQLLEMTLLQLQTDYNLDDPPKIYLHIQSNGGDVHAGLSAMNTLETCKVPVVTIVDGFVASAATLILLGGTERWMRRYSNILIHQISSEFWGKFNDLKDEFKNTKQMMQIIKTIYVDKSQMSNDVVNKIIHKEMYLNADQCSKYGLIDVIY